MKKIGKPRTRAPKKESRHVRWGTQQSSDNHERVSYHFAVVADSYDERNRLVNLIHFSFSNGFPSYPIEAIREGFCIGDVKSGRFKCYLYSYDSSASPSLIEPRLTRAFEKEGIPLFRDSNLMEGRLGSNSIEIYLSRYYNK